MIDLGDGYDVVRNIFIELKKINEQLREINSKLDNSKLDGNVKGVKKEYVPHCPICKKPASKYELDIEDGKSYLGKCDQCGIVFHSTPKEG